jgi:hypothetical protein
VTSVWRIELKRAFACSEKRGVWLDELLRA